MKHVNVTLRLALCAALLARLPAGLLAQDPARGAPPVPPTPEAGAQDMQRAQQEMARLFAEVEHNLRRIDRLLTDAAAGDVPLTKPGDSGLDKLLLQGKARGQNVVKDIDRILELAQQMTPPRPGRSGSGQGKPKPGDGQSPLDKPQGQAQPERTPQKPGGQDPQGTQPKDGKSNDPDPRNYPPTQPPADKPPGAPARPTDSNETWGELPDKAKAVFNAQGGGDMPVQYRSWIDSYYKRLNQRR